MAENSSRLNEAEETQSVTNRPHESDTTVVYTDTMDTGPNRTESAEDTEQSKDTVDRCVLPPGSLLDAAEYVEAVMSSQRIAAVLRTPLTAASGRKRHLSLPVVGESEVKKIRSEINDNSNDNDNVDLNSADHGVDGSTHVSDRSLRNIVRARRNLMGKKGNKSELSKGKHDSEHPQIDDTSDTDKILKAMEKFQLGLETKIDEMNKRNKENFEFMKSEIENIRHDFNKRMEGLAKKVEKKVTQTMEKEIDSKVRGIKAGFDNELRKVKAKNDTMTKSITKLEETTLPTLKEEMGDEIDSLNDKIKRLEEQVATGGHNGSQSNAIDDTKRSIVIKNLYVRENENVKERVNNVIYSGLKLNSITVESATRKPSQNESKPGIIIAVCKTESDKQRIMKRKSDLRKAGRYEKVYIEHNIPLEQRRLNYNFRTIVNTIGNDRLRLKGSRLLQTDDECRNGETRFYQSERPRSSDSYRNRDRNDERQSGSEYNSNDFADQRNSRQPYDREYERSHRRNVRNTHQYSERR